MSNVDREIAEAARLRFFLLTGILVPRVLWRAR